MATFTERGFFAGVPPTESFTINLTTPVPVGHTTFLHITSGEFTDLNDPTDDQGLAMSRLGDTPGGGGNPMITGFMVAAPHPVNSLTIFNVSTVFPLVAIVYSVDEVVQMVDAGENATGATDAVHVAHTFAAATFVIGAVAAFQNIASVNPEFQILDSHVAPNGLRLTVLAPSGSTVPNALTATLENSSSWTALMRGVGVLTPVRIRGQDNTWHSITTPDGPPKVRGNANQWHDLTGGSAVPARLRGASGWYDLNVVS